LTVPDSVTSIGDEAFLWCKSLRNFRIPDSLTEMGVNPFKQCYWLVTVSVSPEHACFEVKDDVLFSKPDMRLIYCHMYKMGKYEIPQGIRIIGESAFYNCSRLEEIVIPDSVTTICDEAFKDCSSLKKLAIPAGVKSINTFAFSGCEEHFADFDIPESVKLKL
jgi:hypothetical protein